MMIAVCTRIGLHARMIYVSRSLVLPNVQKTTEPNPIPNIEYLKLVCNKEKSKLVAHIGPRMVRTRGGTMPRRGTDLGGFKSKSQWTQDSHGPSAPQAQFELFFFQNRVPRRSGETKIERSPKQGRGSPMDGKAGIGTRDETSRHETT